MPDQSHPRRDALPENLEYTDGGCHVSPTCLTCPIPRCIFDTDSAVRQYEQQLLSRSEAVQMKRMLQRGSTIDDVAATYDVSRRTVFRRLAELEDHEATLSSGSRLGIAAAPAVGR